MKNAIEFMPALICIVILIISVPVCKKVRTYFKIRKNIEDMNGYEFEEYCAALIKNDGFYDVEITKGSGDFGIDILAEKDGVTYAIQCKRYTGPVGVKAVQEAFAGRDYYDRMVGVVMTNQYFTSPAVAAAKKLKILLWDGGYLTSIKY